MKKSLRIFMTGLLTMVMMFAFGMNVQAAHPARVVDNADLLFDYEEESLTRILNEKSQKLNFDIVVVTTNSTDGKSSRAYADDFFDYNGYGMGDNYDGAMFIMSMEEREWFILTTDYGIDVLEDYEIDSIGEKMLSDLSAGFYYDAFTTFAEEVEFEVEYGVQEASPSILLSLLIGLVLGLIPAFIIRGKLKSVKMQSSAGGYENMCVARKRRFDPRRYAEEYKRY